MNSNSPFPLEALTGRLNTNSTPHASLGNNDAHQAGSCFFKPPLCIDEQIDHLIEQGILVKNRASATQVLNDVNYYRLRGYWITFEKDGKILSGTSLESIWAIYEFDRVLRHWLWRMIERVELKARTQFAYCLSIGIGPNAHINPANFKSAANHFNSMKRVQKEIEQGRKQGMPCVLHNLNKYGELPLWAAVEVMSMGTVSALYGNLAPSIKSSGHAETVSEEMAAAFGVTPDYLKSWLRHLTMIRNICAHHGRLYNRLLKISPRMLKRDKKLASKRAFVTFVTLKRIYEVSWPEIWDSELETLTTIINTYNMVDLTPLGFPAEWHEVLSRSQISAKHSSANHGKEESN